MGNPTSIALMVALLACGLSSCFSGNDELVGQKKVEGSSDLLINVYQKDEFDFVTAISFELLNDKGLTIRSKKFLTGTNSKLENLEDFRPIVTDSIFYLCYPYPRVHAIFHLDASQSPLSRDTLFKMLQARDHQLVDDEAE